MKHLVFRDHSWRLEGMAFSQVSSLAIRNFGTKPGKLLTMNDEDMRLNVVALKENINSNTTSKQIKDLYLYLYSLTLSLYSRSNELIIHVLFTKWTKKSSNFLETGKSLQYTPHILFFSAALSSAEAPEASAEESLRSKFSINSRLGQ